MNYSGCRKEIQDILKEVKDIVNVCSDGKGISLASEEWEEKGYLITKNDSEVVIKYHRKSDFCRALLMLCKKEGEDSWLHREKSSFDIITEVFPLLKMISPSLSSISGVKFPSMFNSNSGYMESFFL